MSKIITYDCIVKYIFNDLDTIDVQIDKIVSPEFIIGDLNNANSILYLGIEDMPGDMVPEKYCYDGVNYSLNPDFISE